MAAQPQYARFKGVEVTSAKRGQTALWRKQLESYVPQAAYPDDDLVRQTCLLALGAVEDGDFGVGGLLRDGTGKVVAAGHNELFKPYFRSDRHAEMVVMDTFEKDNPQLTKLQDYTFFTSLESCPMCMARLISSGVNTILYAAPDLTGGMVHLMNNLPPVWIQLAQRQKWGQANCSPYLVNAANEIFMINAAELNTILENR